LSGTGNEKHREGNTLPRKLVNGKQGFEVFQPDDYTALCVMHSCSSS
jgi:hypothetical protein